MLEVFEMICLRGRLSNILINLGQLVEHLGFLKESDVDSKTFLEALKAINIFEIALNLCFIALKIGNLKPV